MFNSAELYLINKLLNKIKYSDRNQFELNEFAFSPITNEILEKIKVELKLFEIESRITSQNTNFKRTSFEFDNYVGHNIRKSLLYLSDVTFEIISEWNDDEVEEFAIDIIGPIDYEKKELEKLKKYIKNIALKNTCS